MNEYQQFVYDKISSYLTNEEKTWLQDNLLIKIE
ncbi:hypothetical protein [Holdemanella porci]